MTHKFTTLIDALKSLKDSIDDNVKISGLKQLTTILRDDKKALVEHGYDHVIFKSIIHIINFDSGEVLKTALDLSREHYFQNSVFWDDMMEALLYRIARSNDLEVCEICLENLDLLLDHFDSSIAKHSKQILKLSDTNYLPQLNTLYKDLLIKLKTKLPERIA